MAAAGSPKEAELNYPTGLATDGSVVFIADRGNNCIRKWDGPYFVIYIL